MGKYLRYRYPRALLDHSVHILHGAACHPADYPRDGRLAAAGHTDKDDVHHPVHKRPFDAAYLIIVDACAGEELAASLRLCNEHMQPARVLYAELLRLKQQRRARRVIYDIQHRAAVRKLRQVDRLRAVIRVHAQRRGVHYNPRVAVALKVIVIVLPAAAYDYGFRAEAIEHGAHRGAGSAIAEHERFHPGGVYPVHVQQALEAEHVRVVTVDAAIRAAHQRVHAAGEPRALTQFIAEREHSLFIRDGHVQPVPLAAFYEAFKLLRSALIEPVFVPGKHFVYFRGIAVPQLLPEQSASEHQPRSFPISSRW